MDNIKEKTPVSMSTVKRRFRDAGLLEEKKKPYFRLVNKKKRLRWGKEHRHWTEELCLEGQYPRVASSLLTMRWVFFFRYYLMKLPVEDVSQTRHSNVLVLLLSCAPGPPTPLSNLVIASSFCEGSSTQRCTRSSVSWKFLT